MHATIENFAQPWAATAADAGTSSIEVHPLTVHIGAELRNVSLADAARERLKAAGERVADSARTGGHAAVQTVHDTPALWALAAALGGYGLAWFIHGRRD